VGGWLDNVVMRVMAQVASGEDILRGRGEITAQAARFRRLLHRDLAAAAPGSLSFTPTGFSLATSHVLLADAPIQAEVEWDLAGPVRRVERIGDMGYEAVLEILPGQLSWRGEYLDARRQWLPAESLVIGENATAPTVLALRLFLGIEDREVEMIELLPQNPALGLP